MTEDEQIDFDEYQALTNETALDHLRGDSILSVDDEVVATLALGLVGESGEVAEKVKKFRREDDIEYIDDLEDELGDVLWYLARLADECGYDLSYIAERNVEKLTDRADRDRLTGEGDDR